MIHMVGRERGIEMIENNRGEEELTLQLTVRSEKITPSKYGSGKNKMKMNENDER